MIFQFVALQTKCMFDQRSVGKQHYDLVMINAYRNLPQLYGKVLNRSVDQDHQQSLQPLKDSYMW